MLPGGGIEEGEVGEKTIKREVKEETDLEIEKCGLAFRMTIDGKKHPFYLCQVKPGKIKLGGPEAGRHTKDNWYDHEWISLRDIPKTDLVREKVK